MIIRSYTAADRQACLEAFHSNVPKFFDPSEVKVFEEWLDQQERQIAAEVPHPTDRYLVVLKHDQVVGCGGYFIEPDQSKGGLSWGLLHNAYHKQGLGKAFALYRLKAIQSICPTCIIGLDTTQYTYPFFEKLGFVVNKITPGFYAPGFDRYDMELRKALQ